MASPSVLYTGSVLTWAQLLPLLLFLGWDCDARSEASMYSYTYTPDPTEFFLLFKYQPADTAVRVGQTALLKCLPDHRKPADMTYSWYRLGSNTSLIDSQTVSGSSTGVLRLSNATVATAGQYYCNLTSFLLNGTVTSIPAWVRISEPAQNLTLSPQKLRWPNRGTSDSVAVFQCQAERKEFVVQPSIKWQLYSEETHWRWMSIDRLLTVRPQLKDKYATFQTGWTTTLHIIRPSLRDTFCRLRCRSGKTLSPEGSFHVYDGAPNASSTFSHKPDEKMVARAGERVVIPCATLYRDPGSKMTWYQRLASEDLLVTDGRRIYNNNVSLIGESNLVFESISMSMAGTYMCSTTVNGDPVSVETTVEVVAAPVSVTIWDNYPFVPLRKAHMVCTFLAWPPAKLYWLKNGRRVDLRLLNGVTVTEEDSSPSDIFPRQHEAIQYPPFVSRQVVRQQVTVVFDQALWEDIGSYQCVADNGYGVASVMKRVDVLHPVDFFAHPPSNVTVRKGESFTLPCPTFGLPMRIRVAWLRDRTVLAASGSYAQQVDVDAKERWRYELTRHGSLNVTNARHSDSGRYRCVVANLENSMFHQVRTASRFSYVEVTGERAKPRIDTSLLPGNNTGAAGSAFKLACATSGFPEPNVTWSYVGSSDTRCPSVRTLKAKLRKQRKQSKSPSTFQQFLHATNTLLDRPTSLHDDGAGNLKIDSLDWSHTGRYMCVAHSVLGLDRHCVDLNVAGVPEITNPSWDMVRSLGEVELTFRARNFKTSCEATGTPPPEVRWTWEFILKNGSTVGKGASPWARTKTLGNLVVPENILYANHTCHARNQLGATHRSLVYNFNIGAESLPPARVKVTGETGKTDVTVHVTTKPADRTVEPNVNANHQQNVDDAAAAASDSKTERTVYIAVAVALMLILLIVVVLIVILKRQRAELRREDEATNSDLGTRTQKQRCSSSSSSSGDRNAGAHSIKTCSTGCADDASVHSGVPPRPTGFPDNASIHSGAPQRPVCLWSPSNDSSPVTPQPPALSTPKTPISVTFLRTGEGDQGRSGEGITPISHKRYSFFDFNASCNQLPETEEDQVNGNALLPPCHAKQPSSSWNGVASPLQAAVAEVQETYEEMNPPEEYIRHRASLSANPPHRQRSSSGMTRRMRSSCPNLPTGTVVTTLGATVKTEQEPTMPSDPSETSDIGLEMHDDDVFQEDGTDI
ncbi:uncharacterized protein LOC135809315 isoform X2 [Sycon ciliatum]|uniref:uncharacterized protein LOC135809315 isoform X2 n=1 Tax=Sycon ciliatum TaxID=27933 RepID=UPI0031F6D68D